MSQYSSTYAFAPRHQRAGSAFATRRSASYRRNQNTVAFTATKNLGPVAHTVLVALMLAVLGLIYLTQVTKTSTYGYELSELEQQRVTLEDQKDDLKVENARLQALEQVRQSNVAKAMVAPASVEYSQN